MPGSVLAVVLMPALIAETVVVGAARMATVPHTSQSPAVIWIAVKSWIEAEAMNAAEKAVCVPDCVPLVLIGVFAMAFATEVATSNVLAVMEDPTT